LFADLLGRWEPWMSLSATWAFVAFLSISIVGIVSESDESDDFRKAPRWKNARAVDGDDGRIPALFTFPFQFCDLTIGHPLRNGTSRR
jgi:hypothetical protein